MNNNHFKQLIIKIKAYGHMLNVKIIIQLLIKQIIIIILILKIISTILIYYPFFNIININNIIK